MDRLLVLTLLAFLAPAFEARMVPQIIGGRNAKVGEFPWQASIQTLFYDQKAGTYSDSHICGAVLVAKDWVVTAAHCMGGQSTGSIQVVTGLHKRSDRNIGKPETCYVQGIFVHPDWNPRSLIGDIAMIKLLFEADINEYVKVIDMHPEGTNLDGADCTISGWGVTTVGGGATSDVLQAAKVKALSVNACQMVWKRTGESQLCVFDRNKKGSCNGDSGGPCVCNGKLAGVTSFGQKGCGPDVPSVYTRISYYRKWIKQTADI